jgi:hypothetical protein
VEREKAMAYLGFPWATLFDLLNKSHPRAEGLLAKLESLAGEARKSGSRGAVAVER